MLDGRLIGLSETSISGIATGTTLTCQPQLDGVAFGNSAASGTTSLAMVDRKTTAAGTHTVDLQCSESGGSTTVSGNLIVFSTDG